MNIEFNGVYDLKKNDVEQIVKCNPQLTEIELDGDMLIVDLDIAELIAKHTPAVEHLLLLYFDQHALLRFVKCIGQLHNLNRLAIIFDTGSSSGPAVSAICEMGAAGLPITDLTLDDLDLQGEAERFVDGISQWKNLEKLGIGFAEGLDATHITNICEHLGELIEHDLYDVCLPRAENILNIARKARKLEFLYINATDNYNRENGKEKVCIDVETYIGLVNIVKDRSQKSHLTIELNSFYAADIPEYLTREHKKSLTLTLAVDLEQQNKWVELLLDFNLRCVLACELVFVTFTDFFLYSLPSMNFMP